MGPINGIYDRRRLSTPDPMRVNKLDLNQLVVLDAVLTHRSVSKAAAHVHLTQPAVSASLGKLRNFFGDPLLVQQGVSLALTPFAESLVQPVRDLLLQAQALTHRRPGLDPAYIQRRITLVASDYVQQVLLVPLLERASHEAPGLSFEIRSISGNLNRELDQGDVDLVVSLASGIADPSHSEIIFRDSWSCILCKANQSIGAEISVTDYLKAGHVAVVLGSGRVPTLDQVAVDRLGLTRKVEVHVPSFFMVAPSVVGTRRLGLIQTQLAKMLSQKWPIRIAPVPFDVEDVVTAVQWHRYQAHDPAIQWIRKTLKSIADGLD